MATSEIGLVGLAVMGQVSKAAWATGMEVGYDTMTILLVAEHGFKRS